MDDDTTQRDSHLLSICAALGGYEESERFVEGVGLVEGRYYVMGDETLACLRDLKKLLRNDQSSKEKTVLRALGRWNILQTDLIPILLAAKATGQEKISQTVVQLFVPLTWPVDPESIDAAGQQEIQRGYKEAFLQEGVLQAIMDQLLKPFAKIYRERTDRDHTFVALILTLFRNLLAIRDDQADITSTVEKYRRSTLQEDLIIHLEKADIVALLLSLAGSVDDREYVEYNMIIMEIFYYFFLERDPEHLVSAAKSRSTELAALRAEEQRLKQQARKAATRHSRFGGTLSFKLTDGQTFTVHNPTAAYNSVEEALDKNKGAQREVRNKVGQNEMKKARAVRSSEAARIYSETASAFLANCFNCMVESIRRDFAAERDKVQEHHYARFLWLCSFFLKFQLACLREYHRKGEVNREAGLAPPETSEMDFDTVTEFLDLRGLEFVCGRINRAKDEKRWPEVYVGIDCLKQILLSLDAMMLSADEELREASETIQKNMYYDHSTIELAFSLVTSFKRNHHLSHLKTLVELVHVLLKMLEYYSQQNATMLRRKTVKKKKRPGPQARAEGDESEDGEPDVQNEAAEEAIRESKVTFNHIVARFATDGTVSTYCVLLKHYREVETQYIYFITVMFHRLFFKGGAGAPLFYKLSVLHLFNKILADKRVLPVCKAFSELYAFITYATGKFFKKAEEYPMLFLEVLYTKTKGDCMRIEFGNEDPVLPSKEDEDTGVVKDIEVKPGLTWGEEVQVAVTLLVEKDERELVTWITDILLDAATLRSPRPPTDGVAMDEEVVVSEAYDIKHETEEQGVALQRNVALRLLLRLLSFEEVTDEGPSIFYRIPPIITSTYLLGHRETIIRYLETPNVEDVSDMVRKKPKKRKRKAAASAGTRKAKEVKQFKSKQFVSDSDDDDDAEFYARERALKEKYDAIYKMMMEAGAGRAPRSRCRMSSR
ncbi:timeless protein-domain-containing protein [Fimicolochytrium jonesii]|uniref:timeless protein-domain-containing protein n=1 Tax=Fimicolochytrium jonesii TaxID=1396493 RepID=UPI0022FDD90D|nr:timeless protein-domain-containing protein [Fimicolochytrium jonesii]KAI8821883.1 timeless protein-domain-containing protein [Fimicolochytrium jonesii]